MASMNNQERALHYFERLLKAANPKAELENILSDINSLIFAKSKKPLDSASKVKILEELEELIKRSKKPSFESIDESRSYNYSQKSAKASDNSDILDVISAMKKRVG